MKKYRLESKRLYFEKCDIWFGIYWNKRVERDMHFLDVYICLIPMLPIKLTFLRYNH